MKCAFLTGTAGQCSSYLAELLLDKGYKVYGMLRRASDFNSKRIDHIFDKLSLHYGDMMDVSSIIHILERIKTEIPKEGWQRIEIYNMAAQSHVKVSFENPLYTAQVDAVGVLNLLEAVRITGLTDKVRIYQASTSELYGKVEPDASGVLKPQNEDTPFHPRSPYSVSKLYAYWICKNYREAYGMYICNGICFNMESPRRGPTFITRKITLGIAKIMSEIKKSQTPNPIKIGNLEAKRDWGYAPDYCKGMISMLQADKPDDYVLATGETHSVREFIEEAFKIVGIQIEWSGKGEEEVGKDKDTGRTLIQVDKKYFRPAEVDFLLGDASKARGVLGWKPQVTFTELVKIMVESDLKSI